MCRHAVTAYTRIVTPVGLASCQATCSHSHASSGFTDLHGSSGKSSREPVGIAGAPGSGRASDGCGPGAQVASGNGDGNGLTVAVGRLGNVGAGVAEVVGLGEGVDEGPGLVGNDVGVGVAGAVAGPLDPHAASMDAAPSATTRPITLRFMVRPLHRCPARTPGQLCGGRRFWLCCDAWRCFEHIGRFPNPQRVPTSTGVPLEPPPIGSRLTPNRMPGAKVTPHESRPPAQ